MASILTVNGGSSSIRFALFHTGEPLQRALAGKIERLGTAQATLSAGAPGERPASHPIGSKSAVEAMADWLGSRPEAAGIDAIGHRVVHGMQHRDPTRVTAQLLAQLRDIARFDPEHLPGELDLISQLSGRYPDVTQVLCFDTAFHEHLPRAATLLPIPRRYDAQGIRRYGFHGLSYTYLMGELKRLQDPAAMRGRVILAHLGGGASMAAVRDGQPVDTTMGFTPTGGLVMGTRTGDLDPGLVAYLSRELKGDSDRLERLINHESGLKGMSESSADVRDLLSREAQDARAREALEVFCRQARKWVGALAAVLGGLDTLVFAGGIGENAPQIRARICQDLDFIGVTLDAACNEGHDPTVISRSGARVTVRVIHTDEESVIACQTAQLLNLH